MEVYKITIDDETGMEAVSLVENPAVEIEFLAFSNQQKLAFNEEKRCVTGVVCLADTPIYRIDEVRGEYYVVFDKKTIEKMMIKYSKDGLMNSINIEHSGPKTDGIFLYESYIYNKERGITPKEFTVPDGSWIATFKVENEEVWQKIKKGEVKGFSLEGLFNLEPENEFDNWINSYLA